MQHHYGRFLIMIVLHFIAMYVFMYAMVNVFDNVFNNFNQVYMAGLMTGVDGVDRVAFDEFDVQVEEAEPHHHRGGRDRADRLLVWNSTTGSDRCEPWLLLAGARSNLFLMRLDSVVDYRVHNARDGAMNMSSKRKSTFSTQASPRMGTRATLSMRRDER